MTPNPPAAKTDDGKQATPPVKDDTPDAAPAADPELAPVLGPEHEAVRNGEPLMTADLFSAGDQFTTVAVAGLLADHTNELDPSSTLTRSEWQAAVDKYLKSERP